MRWNQTHLIWKHFSSSQSTNVWGLSCCSSCHWTLLWVICSIKGWPCCFQQCCGSDFAFLWYKECVPPAEKSHMKASPFPELEILLSLHWSGDYFLPSLPFEQLLLRDSFNLWLPPTLLCFWECLHYLRLTPQPVCVSYTFIFRFVFHLYKWERVVSLAP